ncbi:hypothetical protein BVY00_01290 [bacterium G20]|nr:hypothetical protein BVY00_01290 [bacterium G20]
MRFRRSQLRIELPWIKLAWLYIAACGNALNRSGHPNDPEIADHKKGKFLFFGAPFFLNFWFSFSG